jgi:hypothetical protein
MRPITPVALLDQARCQRRLQLMHVHSSGIRATRTGAAMCAFVQKPTLRIKKTHVWD